MMRKKQAGQAFILVLILLAIGALLVVPVLNLTRTSLKSSQIVTRRVKQLYAVDAAQEYILWKLKYGAYGGTFTYDNQTDNISFNCCGIPVEMQVVMRAVVGKGGITLATDEVIRPTKTVEPSVVDASYAGPYTYIIKLEQLSTNTTAGLDAVYDVLPKGLSYYAAGGCQLRVDGGDWEYFPAPSTYTTAAQNRLRWPATLGTYFSLPMRQFATRQVKEIKFQATGSLGPNEKAYNWALLKVGDIDTLSGPVAPITVGNGTNPAGGLLEVSKKSDPEIIPPGVPTEVTYTITITNLQGETDQIQEIIDYLPPDFEYVGPTWGGTVNEPPQMSPETINGIERLKLTWGLQQFPDDNAISIQAGAQVILIFKALATKDVSGSYYNEVTVLPSNPLPSIFQPPDMTVTPEEFNTTYSWNAGIVTVPTYDSRANVDDTTVDTNMALIVGGVAITSYQVR